MISILVVNLRMKLGVTIKGFVFYIYLIFFLYSCTTPKKDKFSYYELEQRSMKLGDYHAYQDLAHANLLSNYDILNTSIYVSQRYNWGFAYYNVYNSLVPYLDENNQEDSSLVAFALFNLNKSIALNFPQGVYDKSFLLREGKYVGKDTDMANELLIRHRRLIDSLRE